jgi:hypothetical protein
VINILKNKDSLPSIITNGRRFADTRRWDQVSQAYAPLFERLTRRQIAPGTDPAMAATR